MLCGICFFWIYLKKGKTALYQLFEMSTDIHTEVWHHSMCASSVIVYSTAIFNVTAFFYSGKSNVVQTFRCQWSIIEIAIYEPL